jgi:hypothetical protein
MMRNVGDIVDRAVKNFFVDLGGFRKPAKFADKLERRSVNFVGRRGRSEVVQGFDISAHAPIVYRESRGSTLIFYFAMQTFLASVKKPAFAKATARQAPRFAGLFISLYKCSSPP